jgi:hypothetical protein
MLSSNQDICWLVSYCLDWYDLGLSAGWNFFLFKGGRLIRRFQIIWNFLKFVYIRISKHYAEELKIIKKFWSKSLKTFAPPSPTPTILRCFFGNNSGGCSFEYWERVWCPIVNLIGPKITANKQNFCLDRTWNLAFTTNLARGCVNFHELIRWETTLQLLVV